MTTPNENSWLSIKPTINKMLLRKRIKAEPITITTAKMHHTLIITAPCGIQISCKMT